MIKKDVLEKTIKNIIEGEPRILKTGFYDIDEMLKNVDYGSLITIGARPAMGKTSFILSILYNLLKENKKCHLFSVELNEQAIIKRMLCIISEVSNIVFRNRDFLTDKITEKLNSAKEELSKLNLTIFEDIIDINQIKNEIEKHKPEYVFIDSLHLLKGFDTKTLTDLKILAKENNCIIFNTCTLPNELEERENKHPLLSDLREVGSTDIVSDVVLFLYRDCYYNFVDKFSDDYNYEDYNAEIIIAKNKTGECGMLNLLWKSDIPKFYNFEKDLLDKWTENICDSTNIDEIG